MAQFVAFDNKVEVNGETVLSVVNAFPEYMRNYAINILGENGISNPQPGEWYKQQNWLNAFKMIAERFGTSTLFEIGKAIPANAKFPPAIDSLEKALNSIDVAYHLNHRYGEIGYYKLTDFKVKQRRATMECKNPYPCEFDRGIITAMVRKFRPKGAAFGEVVLDHSKPSRRKGAESSTYQIEW